MAQQSGSDTLPLPDSDPVDSERLVGFRPYQSPNPGIPSLFSLQYENVTLRLRIAEQEAQRNLDQEVNDPVLHEIPHLVTRIGDLNQKVSDNQEDLIHYKKLSEKYAEERDMYKRSDRSNYFQAREKEGQLEQIKKREEEKNWKIADLEVKIERLNRMIEKFSSDQTSEVEKKQTDQSAVVVETEKPTKAARTRKPATAVKARQPAKKVKMEEPDFSE